MLHASHLPKRLAAELPGTFKMSLVPERCAVYPLSPTDMSLPAVDSRHYDLTVISHVAFRY